MRTKGGRLLVIVAALLAASSAPVEAQGGFLLQGVGDVELWKTDSASLLLARGGGRPSLLGRLDVWAAYEPIRNLILFAEAYGEAGSARGQPGNEIEAKQYGVRYSPSDAFVIEAGGIPQIVGEFSSRALSTRNPLIGSPDGYSLSYPRGARVDGSIGMFDYRVGVLSLPLFRAGYTPDPGLAMRPAIGVGVTPVVGLRVGVSAMSGAYLNPTLTPTQLHSQDWTSYKQRLLVVDAQFSRGYFEGHAEAARSGYDVPGRATPIDGLETYVDGKYTFTPRFFMAARYERNDYPFISPVSPTFWVANGVIFNDVEVGGGYRFGASSLLKASFRKDRWTPNISPQAPHDNGYAVAVQWSQAFDVVELLTRRQ